MKKFGVRDQVGYMLGDVGGSFVNFILVVSLSSFVLMY